MMLGKLLELSIKVMRSRYSIAFDNLFNYGCRTLYVCVRHLKLPMEKQVVQ